MLRSVPLDVLYLCAELVTGKSIPVLVGITRLPVGQGLAWLSVSAGAIAGTCFSVWAARQTQSLALLSFLNRCLQLVYSLGLSVSLLLSLARGVHIEHGAALVLIPAFCLAWQPLPQRHSTALVAFLLSWGVFYLCAIMSAVDAGIPTTAHTLEEAMHHSRLRHTPSQERLFIGRAPGEAPPAASVALTLQEIVLRSLQLFLLGAYACIQHAPTQVYFDARHVQGDWGGEGWDCGRGRPTYASLHHANHAAYSFFLGLVSAWLRVCAWSPICFSQENFLHLMLEGDHRRGDWDWLCCAAYSVALLYSACWTATQLREQVLPRFVSGPASEEPHVQLKATVLIFALAALYRQRDPGLMFGLTHALTAVSVLTAYATLKKPAGSAVHGHHSKK